MIKKAILKLIVNGILKEKNYSFAHGYFVDNVLPILMTGKNISKLTGDKKDMHVLLAIRG